MIRIARVYGTYEFPADFILCAAMNPCPCGHYPDMNRCRCTPAQVSQYQGRISQPLLDRLDLCADVTPVDFEGLSSRRIGESTDTIRERVTKVQELQRERYKNEGIQFNGELKGSQIEKFCSWIKRGKIFCRWLLNICRSVQGHTTACSKSQERSRIWITVKP